MIRELFESKDEVKLKLKEVIGYDSIEDMQSDAGTNWDDQKVAEQIANFLDAWFEEQTHNYERFAVPVTIEVTDDKVYLSEWETFDQDGNDYEATKDEINFTVKVLKKADLEDECYKAIFN